MTDSPLLDRDYSQTFSIELTWAEWNRLHSLLHQGIDAKHDDEWGDDERERDRRLRKKVTLKIGESSPGNGIDDWPESMRRAYNESVRETIEELRE